jgi:hypothetical protein
MKQYMEKYHQVHKMDVDDVADMVGVSSFLPDLSLCASTLSEFSILARSSSLGIITSSSLQSPAQISHTIFSS